MNKKIRVLFIVFICLITVFTICGCSNQEKKELNEDTLKKIISDKYPYSNNKIVCDELEDAIAFNYKFSYFATKNKVYKLNEKQLFSNEKNCKELEIENLDSDIVDFDIGNRLETKAMKYAYEKNIKKFSHLCYDYEGKNYGCNYGESLYKRVHDILGNITFYSDYNHLENADGIVVKDNELKIFRITYENQVEDKIKDIGFVDVKLELENDEKVLFIIDNIIKTNKAYYEVKAYKTNKEKCSKYADVKCEYGYKLVKDDFLTNNYQYIKFVSKYNLIDINNNFYSNSF